MKPPIGKREYRVYMKIDTRLPGAEIVNLNGPAFGVDSRDALANAIGQVYASFEVFQDTDRVPVNGIRDPRPLVFPVAAIEVVPTAEELLAEAAPVVKTVRARR